MTRLRTTATLTAAAALAIPAAASAKAADVFVTNTADNPVPTQIVGTPTVQIQGTPTVALEGTPTVVTTPASRPTQIYFETSGHATISFRPIPVPGDRPLLLRKVIVARTGPQPPLALQFVLRIKVADSAFPATVEIPIPLEDGRGSVDLGGIYFDPNAERAELGDAVELRADLFSDQTERYVELIILADRL